MKTLALGEVLWDIIEKVPHLGGAPFNVSAHLSKMGATAYVSSSVGKDALGEEALKQAKSLGIQMDYLTQNDLPTGTVPVVLTNGQPSYTITEQVAWDAIHLSEAQLQEINRSDWDCVIFGTLAQRTPSNQALFEQLLDGIQARVFFYDVNLRQHYYSKEIVQKSLQKASIFKLNDEEVLILSDLLFDEQLDFEDFAHRCISDFNIVAVCITRGAEGVLIVTNDQNYDIPGVKVQVADTVGAGDSFSAAFLYTYLKTTDFQLAGSIGCRVGAFVASQNGAIPTYSEELKRLLNP